MVISSIHAAGREKYNFNSGWKLKVGDIAQAESVSYLDTEWKSVTLPHAFNEDEAFKLNIKDLTDTIVWYRKHFRLPADAKGRKVFIEFEGARQGLDLYVNGHLVGQHENGVMAFGFDLTAFVKPGKENVIAARIDNNWDYAEKATGVKYQWSNRNFIYRSGSNCSQPLWYQSIWYFRHYRLGSPRNSPSNRWSINS